MLYKINILQIYVNYFDVKILYSKNCNKFLLYYDVILVCGYLGFLKFYIPYMYALTLLIEFF